MVVTQVNSVAKVSPIVLLVTQCSLPSHLSKTPSFTLEVVVGVRDLRDERYILKCGRETKLKILVGLGTKGSIREKVTSSCQVVVQ